MRTSALTRPAGARFLAGGVAVAGRGAVAAQSVSYARASTSDSSAAVNDRARAAEMLTRVGFTDHAIERFGERAGLGSTSRSVVEPIARMLLASEGRIVERRPRWARSRSGADLYLQLGEWMLFVACHDRRAVDRYAVVTVVNGPAGNTWPEAVRRGYINARPPTIVRRGPRRVHLLASIVVGVRAYGGTAGAAGPLAAIRRVHARRRVWAQAEYERALLDWIATWT